MTTAITPTKTRRSTGFYLGILTVPLFMMGLMGSTLIATGTYPSPFDEHSKIIDWMTANQNATILMAVTQVLSAIALLVFVANLANTLRAKASGAWAGLVSGAGTLSAGFLMLSALLTWTATRPEVLDTPAVARLAHDLSFLTGGGANVVAFGVMAAAASIGLFRTLPRWIAVLGMVVGAVSVLSVASLAFEPAAFLLPIARFPGFAWVVATALVLGRREQR